jgi:hypothetical protein
MTRALTAVSMLPSATPAEARSILGAMASVASAAGTSPLSAADRATLEAAHHYVFRVTGALALDTLPPVSPARLAADIPDPALREHAARLLAVMALVDGRLDERKIGIVLEHAHALGIHADYLRQLAEAAQGHLQWVAMDMMRRNIGSITGLTWKPENPAATFLPYAGSAADQALARRYQALGELPLGTLGRALWAHYRTNGYAFPGETTGLNEKFATPHDSTHVLSGYSTSPHGELLVSTFTASMHRQAPMAGHILPVIFSWHLGIQLNPVAKSATGAFDPAGFWVAWARGADVTVDVFGRDWDFWAVAREPVPELRRRYAIAPLAPTDDATLALLDT